MPDTKMRGHLDNPLRDGRWDTEDPVCNATTDLVDAVNALQAAFNHFAYNDEEELSLDEALRARKEAINQLLRAQEAYDASDCFFHGGS